MKRFLFATAAVLCISFLEACSQAKADRGLFEGETVNKVNLMTNAVALDSFYLDSTATSFSGSLHVYKNNLQFIDYQFCWVFRFDKDGKLKSREIGQGDGAKELPCKRITEYVSLADGRQMFFGPSWDVYLFDSSFNKISDYRIDWHPKANKEYMLTHPDPSDPIMYSVTYGLSKFRADENDVYLPLFSQHTEFNPIHDWYAKDARMLGRMNVKGGDVKEMMGRLSPIYARNKETRTFSYLHFDMVAADKMAITYPADSSIYLFNKDFSLVKKFGKSGRNMDTNYKSTDRYEQMKPTWVRENREKGFYTSIDYIPERKLLFRSYHKSEAAATDGLQVYSEDELRADVDIPQGCNIIGYISPYFYMSPQVNEETGKIKVYRFKLSF